MEYKTYVPGVDDAALLKLRAVVWGADHPHTNAGFLEWLFQKNPAGLGSGVLMMEHGDPVGFAGMSPKQVTNGGKVALIAHCIDYMVHPTVRSRPSSYRLMAVWQKNARDAGFHAGMGSPNGNSYRIVTSRKLGWKPIFFPLLMVRPLSGIEVSSSLTGRLSRKLATLTARAVAGISAVCAISHRYREPRGRPFILETFDARFDEFWKRIRDSDLVGTWRDSRYLNWRYCNHPVYSYTTIGWDDSGQICGFVILSKRALLGLSTILIVDLLAAETSPAVMSILLREAVRYAKKAGCHALGAQVIPGSSLHRAFKHAGFISVPRLLNPKPFVMTMHDLGTSTPIAMSPQTCHFTWGDTDVV